MTTLEQHGSTIKTDRTSSKCWKKKEIKRVYYVNSAGTKEIFVEKITKKKKRQSKSLQSGDPVTNREKMTKNDYYAETIIATKSNRNDEAYKKQKDLCKPENK